MSIIWNRIIAKASYMRRWGLRGGLLTVYVHRYAGGDTNERMHNHPWRRWFSFVLRGYLIEARDVHGRCPDIILRDRERGIESQDGEMYHQIIYAHPGTVTLFVGWRRRGGWGFQPPPKVMARASSRYLAGLEKMNRTA